MPTATRNVAVIDAHVGASCLGSRSPRPLCRYEFAGSGAVLRGDRKRDRLNHSARADYDDDYGDGDGRGRAPSDVLSHGIGSRCVGASVMAFVPASGPSPGAKWHSRLSLESQAMRQSC